MGYWEIKVDEESSHILALSTSLGRYRFKRLSYGIHSASKVFQWEITCIISDVPGSANSQDDIIVWSRTLSKHNEHLNKLFLKIRKSGLNLNKKKCQIGVKSVVFLGHIISSECVKVDPAKIEAITKMSLSNSVNELQWFLGMITYVGKFIPNLVEVTCPFLTLLKKEVEFKLEKPQLDAIRKLRLLVTTTPSLKIFNPNLQTRLAIVASSEGLGALLEQNYGTLTYPKWYPVGYVSQSLWDYEKRYIQIKKETLSIVFERFHEYLYRCKFTVIIDHQPVKLTFSKSIVNWPSRIQKFFLRLQKYEFDLKYSPGKTMLVLDALSGAYIKNSMPELMKIVLSIRSIL